MSHYTEHQKMKPVLDLARVLDIATNPQPAALFEVGSGGFQVWCTVHDHPQGWEGIVMNAGAFAKPCEYVGSVHWQWQEDSIVALKIETTAYALADQKPDHFGPSLPHLLSHPKLTIFNRAEDLEWLQEKITWLFMEARVPLLPFTTEDIVLAEPVPHLLTHYVSSTDEYVVIVSPNRRPEDFCHSGYEVARTQEVWQAEDFPLDVILRPEREYSEVDSEPDEGPLVEQYENASRLGEDDWLEARLEDQISGWEE